MMVDISYQKCLDEMYGLGRFGIKLGMETTEGILDALGSPEKKFKSIHIAGTNGKGSIASYIASILCAAGFKTGLYTSPHLVKFNERFVINNCEVSDDDVVEAYLAVKQADTGERKATFFELATAMGFYLFGREDVEWAVIETGMGGRLDATNVLKPEVSVISNLSIEHTMYLGNTIEKIAMEKGGIIKEKIPVVSGVTQNAALSILKKTAERKNSPFYLYGRDFTTDVASITAGTDLTCSSGISFDYNGIKNRWKGLKTGLKGDHQTGNAALALAAVEIALTGNEPDFFPITGRCTDSAQMEKIVRKGLIETTWPGRLEYIMEKPVVILDGAHNLDAAENLGRYLKEKVKCRHLTMVIGILDDKPCESMLKFLTASADRIVFTKAAIDRSLEPVVLKEYAMKITKAEIIIIDDVAEAVDFAVKNSSDRDAVCVAGSLYVAGEARKRIQENFFMRP